MKFNDTGRNHRLAALAGCGLLICLTLIPIIQYQAVSQPEILPIMYD